MTLTRDQYMGLVMQQAERKPFDFDKINADATFVVSYDGPTYPKERPQFNTKTKRTFTPKTTVQYEKSVADTVRKALPPNFVKYVYPVQVVLTFYEAFPEDGGVEHYDAGLVFSTDSDLDNKAKAVLDALNKIVWDDDKRVAILDLRRRYAHKMTEGFTLGVSRCGLSQTEYRNFKKFRESYRAQFTKLP